MSSTIMSMIWKISPQKLNAGEKTVLIRMSFIGNNSGKNIFAPIQHLSKQVSLNKNIVINTIKSLIDLHVLILVKEGSPTDGPAQYKINLPVLMKMGAE